MTIQAINTPSILLASSSPYRAAALNKLGLAFLQVAPNIDESAFYNELPCELAKRLSTQKAEVLAKNYPNSVIIASDQVAATHDNQFLGKPGNRQKAIQQLTISSGKQVDFYTGLAVHYMHPKRGLIKQLSVETCSVYFRQLSASQIVNYVDREKPFDCAGSFKSEGLGVCLFTRIDVQDPNTLIGLPLIRLSEFLQNIDIDVLGTNIAK